MQDARVAQVQVINNLIKLKSKYTPRLMLITREEIC